MSLWVNENGTMKEISISREDLTNIIMHIKIAMPTWYWGTSTPASLGFTNAKLVNAVGDSGNTRPRVPNYADIESSYKITFATGSLPLVPPMPANVVKGSFGSTPNGSIAYRASLAEVFGRVGGRPGTYYTYVSDKYLQGSSETGIVSVTPVFYLRFEDNNKDYSIEGVCLRTSAKTEANALSSKLYTTNVAYGTTPTTGKAMTDYFINASYSFSPTTYDTYTYESPTI